MFIVSMLTIIVGFIGLKVRIASVKKGLLSAGYFNLMQGEQVPDSVIKTTRCLSNLFEIPVLFYVVCILYIVQGLQSDTAMVMAWVFAVARCAQAYIHITYNHVRHRMLAFGISVLCVLCLWINLMLKI